MPIVELHLLQGYAPDAKARLGTALTAAVGSVIPAAPEAITVMIHEIAPDAYMRGGRTRTPTPALPDPEGLVRDFLAAMERRDLVAARGFLADGFEMIFPGGVRMTRLEELVDWARGRYAFVKKSYERFDVAPGAGAVAVHCHGTLSGEWLDGTAFEGIRFIDRFEVAGGRFVRQDVWNDIAEVRARG